MSNPAAKLPSFEKMAGRLRPTIGGPLAGYVRALLNTGLYGDRESDVIRSLIREGVQSAIERGLIHPIINLERRRESGE